MTNQIQNSNEEVSRGGAKAQRSDFPRKEVPDDDAASLRLCASARDNSEINVGGRMQRPQQNSRGPIGRGLKEAFPGFSPIRAFDELSQTRNQNTTRRGDGVEPAPSSAPSKPSPMDAVLRKSKAGEFVRHPLRRGLTRRRGAFNHHRAPRPNSKWRIIYWVCFVAIWLWCCAALTFCAWRFG
jgi:hypothetical protein